MKGKIAVPKKTFRQAVKATDDVATGYQIGLTALGAYSSKIEVHDTRLLQGSLDIDKCTAIKYPQDNRWDYAFAYNDEVFFLEVHSVNSSDVKIVLKKFQWLKDWLSQKAPKINQLKASSRQPYYWIQTKNFSIPKTSPQYRAAESKGMKPIAKLVLR